MHELKDASQRKLSFLATVKTICWSFLGIRKKSAHDDEVTKLNPLFVIIAGILGAVLFVITLLLIVKSVIANQ